MEEWPASIALVGPLSPQGIFERLDHYQTVDGRFSSQEASFTPVLVVAGITEETQTRANSHQRTNTPGGKRLVVSDGARIIGKMGAVIAICGEQCRGKSTGWHEPIGI